MPEDRERTHYMGDGCTPPHDPTTMPVGGTTRADRGLGQPLAVPDEEPLRIRIEGRDRKAHRRRVALVLYPDHTVGWEWHD